MLAETVHKGVLDNGNFCTEREEFSTFKTGIPGGPACGRDRLTPRNVLLPTCVIILLAEFGHS